MNLKKLLALGLSLTMATALLAGCGSTNDTSADAGSAGESSDNANKSAYPKTFSEPLTFELYEHHIEISEAAKP